jgi:hypothetical protein
MEPAILPVLRTLQPHFHLFLDSVIASESSSGKLLLL